MRGREAIGYVVSVEGARITLNLNDSHKGHVASHRSGVSSVTDINSFLGVDGGPRILVVRVVSLSFLEPREAHKTMMPQGQLNAMPLRQLNAVVAGWLNRTEDGKFVFTADSLTTPSLGAEAFPLSRDELSAVINPELDSEGALLLGTDCRSGIDLKTGIDDFLGRHIAVLGSSGQGKSCFSAAIIQQLVKLEHPRIVIFDINGEFEPAFKGHLSGDELKITCIGGGEKPYKIPYYALGRHGLSRLLLPSEKTQRPALSFALEHLRHVKWFADEDGVGLSDQQKACMFDDCRPEDATESLNAIQKLRSGQSVKESDQWPHMAALAALVAESHSVQQGKNNKAERSGFHYSNIAPLVTRIRRFIDDPMFRAVLDVDGGKPCGKSLNWGEESSALVNQLFGDEKSKWKLHILNLKHIAHDLMPVVLGGLLELFAFELFRRGQGKTHPTLLVLEEAHHYLRQITDDDGSKNSLAYERLAKEGRKFGLGLWISTQRPSEVSDTVLAQCGTWVVFRLTSETDQRTVGTAAEWIDKLEVSRIAGLPRQQALVFGACIPVPVRINAPTAKPLPNSEDPDFSQWYKKD